jgi:hypothetical protein
LNLGDYLIDDRTKNGAAEFNEEASGHRLAIQVLLKVYEGILDALCVAKPLLRRM